MTETELVNEAGISVFRGRQVGGGGPSVLSKTTKFSTAELLAATTLIVVPAQGPNTIIVPSLIVGFIHAGATPFTYANSGVLFVGAGGSNWSTSWNGFNGIITSPVDAVDSIDFGYEVLDNDGYTVATDVVDHPLTLDVSGPITAGDGSLSLIATYAVFDVS